MEFRITDGRGNSLAEAVSVTPVHTEGGVEIFALQSKTRRERIRLEWEEKMLDHYSVWHPTCGRNRGLPQWFHEQKTGACYYCGAPVLAAVRADGTVRCAVALADAVTQTELSYYVDDFTGQGNVVFTAELRNTGADYATQLRIDRREISLSRTLGDVWRWWAGTYQPAAALPEDAFAPLYSSWYNFHQTPEQGALTADLKLAAELGFKTVILDDGWQIEGAGTKDYRKSGDWRAAPDKFPDFGGFVRDVHALGQKLILWFSVPFVGYETEAYRRFKDKLLTETDGYIYAGTMDIRYPVVRRYLTDTYARYTAEYGIDGLKLDFIDSFRDSAENPAFCEGMDVSTVTEAADLLLRETVQAVTAVKPDFLFEYRQNYVGPAILRYANMLRVCDCAFDPVTNRIGAVDLRMMTENIAVHSDMLLWRPDEIAENCALQLLNILFAVPQISVRLADLPETQLRLLKAHLRYREANRRVLLRERIEASHPETGYSAVWADCAEEDRRVTVLYAERACTLCGRNEDVWNAAGGGDTVLLNPSHNENRYTVYDCFCEEQRQFTSSDAAVAVNVPPGGYVNIAPVK